MKTRILKAVLVVLATCAVALGGWLVWTHQPTPTRARQSSSAPANREKVGAVARLPEAVSVPTGSNVPGKTAVVAAKVEKPAGITKPLISVLPLDLSRPPTTEELMAAGQLGGLLYPTHPLEDKARDEAARLDFGIAIEKWNEHQYPEAVQLFKNHVQKFPDSPWADEATLHVGCDATYNGNYPVAEAAFTQLIVANQANDDPGAKMMWSKATQRLALVKVEQNNLDEANLLFADLERQSPDWQLRTYAMHWLQRLSGYAAAREAPDPRLILSV